MNARWQSTRLGDLVRIKHGWPFKSELCSTTLTGLPLVVSVGNFRYTGGFRFDSTECREYRGPYPDAYELVPGDVLVVMTCQTPGGEILGIPGRIPDDGCRYLHNQRLGKVEVLDSKQVTLAFLYYVFLWRDFNAELVASSTGTKIVHTAPSRIEAFRFDLPTVPEQHAIARILGTLDEKIELNRRMNLTLGALAQKLFKSWFVDFDPVVAKSEGRTPFGLSDELAALFPSEFEDSELGQVPLGWRPAPLGDAIQLVRDLVDPQAAGLEEFDHYSIPAFDSGQRPVREMGSAIKSGKYLVPDDAILLSKLNPETPRVWWPTPDAHRRAIASTEFLVCRAKPEVSRIWLYWQLRDADFLDEFATRVTGTSNSHQRVRPDDLLRLVRVDPGQKLRDRFAGLVEASTKRMVANLAQSQKLAALRDLLLPRLLSGELRVPVAESAIAAAL